MSTATSDADLDTSGTTAGDQRPPDGRPAGPRPAHPAPGSGEGQPTTLMSKKDPATGETVAANTSGPTTGGALHVNSSTGPSKPFHQVKLQRLPKNPEVSVFIGQAELAMQQSVDVLGFGRSDPPPPPKNGKTPDKVQTASVPGTGKGVELYKQQVFSAGARQDSMVGMDAQVDGTSQMVAAEQAQALFSIQHVEADLNTALRSVVSKKLNATEEATVMDHISAAVTKVHDIVQAAQDVNVGAAGGGGSGSAGGGGSAGGAAGAAAGGLGSLGSMLPMLAMLPMALMPMLGQLPELLGQKKDDEGDEDDDNDEPPPSQPAPAAGPAPSDPTTTAPPDGAAPKAGEGAPQDPAPPPQNNIPYGPTPPGQQV